MIGVDIFAGSENLLSVHEAAALGRGISVSTGGLVATRGGVEQDDCVGPLCELDFEGGCRRREAEPELYFDEHKVFEKCGVSVGNTDRSGLIGRRLGSLFEAGCRGLRGEREWLVG